MQLAYVYIAYFVCEVCSGAGLGDGISEEEVYIRDREQCAIIDFSV